MISEWIGQSGVFAIALALVFIPGLAVVSAFRIRGLLLWAVSPAISIAVLAILAIVFSWLGIAWTPASALLGCGVIATTIWAMSIPCRRWSPPTQSARLRRSERLLIAAGLLIGFVGCAAPLMTYIGSPTAVSQTNDAVFHLNALRWIEQTGSASSFGISGVIGSSSFYPAAWHAWSSLVVMLSGTIPISVNMVALIIAAVIWPLGVAVLVSTFDGATVRTIAFAAALAGGMRVFPQLMFEWGVLYPYALALALVPPAIALSIRTLRCRGWQQALGFGIVALAASVAVALSQPAALLVVLLFVIFWAVGQLWSRRGTLSSKRARVTYVALFAGAVALCGLWGVFVYGTGPVLWRGYRTFPRAMVDMLLNSQSQVPAAVGLSALMIGGMIHAGRQRQNMWLIVAWLTTAALYVTAVGPDLPVAKRLLTGPWYGDSFRLAAVVPVAVIPLAALGLDWILGGLASRCRWASGHRLSGMALASVLAATCVWLLVLPVSQLRIADETDAYTRYSINQHTYLSSDELALIRELHRVVPLDARVVANPSTGAAFAYSLGDINIFPRTWAPPDTEAWHTIATSLRDAEEKTEVCSALAAYGAPEYVLDFGRGGSRPGEYLMPGMTGFADQPGFEKVVSVGRSSLWRITACAR